MRWHHLYFTLAPLYCPGTPAAVVPQQRGGWRPPPTSWEALSRRSWAPGVDSRLMWERCWAPSTYNTHFFSSFAFSLPPFSYIPPWCKRVRAPPPPPPCLSCRTSICRTPLVKSSYCGFSPLLSPLLGIYMSYPIVRATHGAMEPVPAKKSKGPIPWIEEVSVNTQRCMFSVGLFIPRLVLVG